MDFIHLRVFSGHDSHACSKRRSITFRPDQFDLDPIVLIPAIVAEQRGNLIHVVHDNVDVAVVVEIAEGTAATRMARSNPGPHFLRNILEFAIAEVAINNARFQECLIGMLIHSWINMSIDLEDIGPAIVVVIDKAASPLHTQNILSNACFAVTSVNVPSPLL